MRYSVLFTTALLSISALSHLAHAAPSALYVSPTGSDKNAGTSPDKPFKSIEKARDTIRQGKYNQKMTKDFTVYLRGGRYELNDTLYFDARDSGSNGHYVVYQAYKKEQPILSGGRRITGWKPVPKQPYFVADVPPQKHIKSTSTIVNNRKPPLHPRFYEVQALSDDGFASYFTQLYVNGVRAERARSADVCSSSRKQWWDDKTTGAFRDGIYVKKSAVKNYTNPQDIRILWLQLFKTMEAPVADFIANPDNPDEMIIKMKQPAFLKGSSWQRIAPNKQFFIVNALEELDEPGEWYLDQHKHKVYYYPCKRDGDINQAEIYAPRVEGLMKLDGGPVWQVHHMRFDGLTFEHGNWTDPKDHYLGLSQAEIYRTYTSEFPGQVVLNYADDITLTNCTVRHMGSCGIQLYEGCDNVLIEGNTTYDTTGAGITVGKWWQQKWDCPIETICTGTKIYNNVVRNTGRDYWQATGINIFTAYNCKVYHNDVSDTAYTAIHGRTGDSAFIHPKIGKLEYKYNKVSRGFAGHKWGIGDGGHLYMHGRYPSSLVEANYSLHTNSYVNLEYYADNDSHTILWTRNVSQDSHAHNPFRGNCFTRVVFKNNYSDRQLLAQARKKGQKTFAWPKDALDVMKHAGLQPKWRYLTDSIYGHENLAEGKTCTSSSDSGSAYNAARVNDNNWKSFWRSKPPTNGKPNWWAVDLGQAYIIQKVGILPIQGQYEVSSRKMLEIQASNTPDFKTHVVLAERNELPWYYKSNSSNLWEQFINIKTPYRYLRVISTDPTATLSMGEFFAFGYPEKKK